MKITIFDLIEIEGTKEELLDISIDLAREFLRISLDRADELEIEDDSNS